LKAPNQVLPDWLLPLLLSHQWTGDEDDEGSGGGGRERGDEQTVEEMRVEVMKLCDSLVKREVLNVSPIEWNGEFGEEEERALSRAGFLIDQYEVDYWWLEGLEMLRKLSLTTLLVFLSEDSVVQVLVALLISLAAFAFAAIARPFVDPTLNKLLLFGLATQVVRPP